MNQLKSRLRRIERSGCMYVTRKDFKLLAESSLQILERAGKKLEDYRQAANEIAVQQAEHLARGGAEESTRYLKGVAESDFYAFQAHLYLIAPKILPRFGTWVSKRKHKGVLENILRLRKEARERVK